MINLFQITPAYISEQCPHYGRAVKNFLLITALIMLPAGTYTVGNDRGGDIDERIALIDHLNSHDTQVRITGKFCYSACTMMLGADHVCISAKTIFGFHGPTDADGNNLSRFDFLLASMQMSIYYPDELQNWYYDKGRYAKTILKIKGRNLIRMGIPECLPLATKAGG